jgi:tetratricopeptide (TPR) repeat protein
MERRTMAGTAAGGKMVTRGFPLARAALLGCWGLLALGARSEAQSSEGAISTGGGHLVVVSTSPSEGLEVGIPRGSWYARGIALDQQGRWEESYNAYREAQGEFERLLKERPGWDQIIRGWQLKAEFQGEQSQRLKYPPYYRYGSPSSSVLYYRAAAMHNKWLGIRAFTGRLDRKLEERIIADYRNALQQSPSYDSARLALAAMLHEVGRHSEARQEFARVNYVGRGWLAIEVGYYFCAAGETDRAMEMLEKAIQYNSSSKRHVLRSNDFDRLRANPRFKILVGAP